MPEDSTTPDLVELTRGNFEALSRRDFDIVTNRFAPDAVYEAVSLGTTFEGVEPIRGFLEDWLGAYAEYEMKPEEIVHLGSGVVFVVLRLTGRPAAGGNALMRRRPVILVWRGSYVTRAIAPSSDLDEARAAAERLAEERRSPVSGRNVELVRRLYEGLGGPKLDQLAEEIWDPEIEWHASELFGVLHGREAVLRQIAEWADRFDDWQIVAEELIDAGDDVVGVTHQRGSGKASGASLDVRFAVVFTIRAGCIVRVREYATTAEALKAVGFETPARSANLDLVRLIHTEWARGDFSSTNWAHPDIEFAIPDGPEPFSARGIADMGRRWREILKAWEGYRVDVEGYRELSDEEVLVLTRYSGRGKTSGMQVGEITTSGANVLRLREGKVIRLVAYWDRDRALADLGVAP